MELKEENSTLAKSYIKKEYAEKINKIFKDNNFNWIASPALISPYVFLKPRINNYKQLNTEALPFQDIIKISFNTKQETPEIGLIAYPSINKSDYKIKLENIGYIPEIIEGQTWLSFLVKPLKKLDDIVKELKNLESILLPKSL